MEQTNRLTFDVMCDGRQEFDSRKAAAPETRRRHLLDGKRWEALPCGYGNHFHVGRVNGARGWAEKRAKRRKTSTRIKTA